MRFFRQICSLTGLGIRSVRQRPGTASMIIIGITAVVAVLLSMLILVDSLNRAITSASRADRAVVLSRGAALENQSVIRRASLAAIESSPPVGRDGQNKPIASVELLGRVRLREKSNDVRSVASVRGVSPSAFVLRPEIKLLDGRLMQPGLHELLVGRAAQSRYSGLNIGDVVTLRDSPWIVVGAFSAAGSWRESEILADTETLAGAYNKSAFQSVWVQMESPAAIDTLRAHLENDNSLGVDVTPEPEYTRRESAAATRLFRLVAYLVGIVMAAAATFGTATLMYAVLSDRTREIATLRALGFSPAAVVVSILAEVSVLALIGVAIGATLVAAILNGVAFHSTYINVELHLSMGLTLVGLAAACVISLLSGLFPAVLIARSPVALALRAI